MSSCCDEYCAAHDAELAESSGDDTDFGGLAPIDHILYQGAVLVLCTITGLLSFGLACWMLDLHRDAIAELYWAALRAWL